MLQDLPRLGLHLTDLNLSATHDVQLLGESLSLSLGLARGLNRLDFSLQVVQFTTFLLSECLILDLSLLECSLGLLLVFIRTLLGLSLLHLGGDLDG